MSNNDESAQRAAASCVNEAVDRSLCTPTEKEKRETMRRLGRYGAYVVPAVLATLSSTSALADHSAGHPPGSGNVDI